MWKNKLTTFLKEYLSSWNFTRILRLAFAGVLVAGYFSTKEPLYLVASLFLGAQALLNFGCPGGSCATPAAKRPNKVMKFKKLELNDNK